MNNNEKPKSGNMLTVWQIVNAAGKGLTLEKIAVNSDLDLSTIRNALRNCVAGGYLTRSGHIYYAEAYPLEKEKPAQQGHQIHLRLAPTVIARLDAEVKKQRNAGRHTHRADIVRLAILAYTRPPKRKTKAVAESAPNKSVVESTPKKTFWSFFH